MTEGYYYCLNCHSEITPDYNEHCSFCGTCAIAVDGDYTDEEVERAFDLLNKEQEGRLYEVPYNVGDTVYVPWIWEDCKGIATVSIEEIKIYDKQHHTMFFIDMGSDDEDFNQYYGGWKLYTSIGKTVFRTPEAAERVLEGGENNE